MTFAKYQAVEIIYRAHDAAVEGVVEEEKSVTWGGVRTKGEVHECELTKNMFFHSGLLKLCHKKNGRSLSSPLTPLFFTIKKLAM